MPFRYFVHPSHHAALLRVTVKLSVMAVILTGLWWLPKSPELRRIASYLPLHTALEILAVGVAGLIFAVGWNAPHRKLPGNMVLLSCAFFGVGLLDLSHLLSFPGMPQYITVNDGNKAISFWLMARLLAATTLLTVAVTPWRQFESAFLRHGLLGGVLVFTALTHWLILFHPDLMPRTVATGQGLTPFKVAAEYVLIGFNVATMLALLWRMRAPLTFNAVSLLGAVAAMAMSEFLFTLYVGNDVYNLAGHLYKIVSYLFLYQAVFLETIERPYRDLDALQDQLKATLAAVPDLIFEIDLDGRYHQYHSSPNDSLAAEPEYFIGRTVVDVLPPDAARVVMQAIREANEKGVSTGHRFALELPIGKRGFELSVARKESLGGEPSRFVVLSRDTTQRQLAEEQLRLSEQNLATTLQSIGDAVIVTDTAGLITRMNTTAERLTGWPLVDAMSRPLSEVFRIVNAKTRVPANNPVQLVIEQGAIVGLANDAALLARDGGEYQIADSAAPIRSPDGKIVGVVLVFSDVTEDYRVRQALASTAELLERTGEMAKVGGWELDLQTWQLFWSLETYRIHEVDSSVVPTLESAIGFYPPNARPVIQAAVQASIERGTSFDLELPLVTAQGRPIWVRAQGSPVMDNGKAIKLLGAFHDITARKEAEAALQKSEERLRTIIETEPECVKVTGPTGELLEMNAAGLAMLEVGSLEQARSHLLLNFIEPSYHAAFLALHQRVMRGEGGSLEFEVTGLRGTRRWLETNAAPMRDAEGRVTMVLGITRDITARKQAEAARASLEAQLRESHKMQAIGTLAGGVAHDFNNIIATILGNTELARQDVGANQAALVSLSEIRKAATRARDLVQQILSFSRRQPTEKKLIALAPVIEESARLLRATLPASLVLHVSCAAAVPNVLADVTQIKQVLINLATNAMQAMRGASGRIDIRLDTVMLDAALADTHPELAQLLAMHPGCTVRIRMSDDGSGMDAATLERVFEPFFTTKAVGEGTGLGLSVVHGIVQTHDGAMTVRSQLGKGSTFTFYLPTVPAHAEVPTSGESAAATPPTPNQDNGPRVLYIDDDESLVLLVQRLLQQRGFRVSSYIDQRQALNALRANPDAFDLVVTDYNMPGMSGLDVARAVRLIRADLPVAVASGFIDEALRAQAAAAAIQELIFKADVMEDFCEVIQRLARTASFKQSPSDE